jgi:hypothetical protein
MVSHNAAKPQSRHRYIILTQTSTNNGVNATECGIYHNPTRQANANLVTGPCTDTDLDQVQDKIDNCPGVANFDQADRRRWDRGRLRSPWWSETTATARCDKVAASRRDPPSARK